MTRFTGIIYMGLYLHVYFSYYLNNSITIGLLYEYGYGVRKNYAQAMYYYELSANQNYADALYHLGDTINPIYL